MKCYKPLYQYAITCLILFSSSAFSQAASNNTPNVIFIMTDDVGYGDIGSYGAPDISTPALDQLADEGVRFTDFYANAAVCSPTRAGFMTGRYQQRYGFEIPLGTADRVEGFGLVSDGRSLPSLLKSNGYATGLVGKWHLGYAPDQSPNAHGFDYFFGFKAGYADYYQHTNSNGEHDLWENTQSVYEEGYMTDLITRHSVDFINTHANEPFFLSVQYNAAHWPYQRPDSPSVAIRNSAHLMPDEANTSTRDDYIAILERADQGIGEILQALSDQGLSDNTLVIFTNDNGGEWLSNNAPLFNRKYSTWEGGIRVPAIMRWPRVIPAGLTSGQVGITMDFTATILAITNTSVPADLDLEGINLMPILTGANAEQDRTLFWRTPNDSAVRSGDLKLVVNRGTFIFNVREDLGERHDLTNQSQSDARRLRAMLDAWVADVDTDSAAYPTPNAAQED